MLRNGFSCIADREPLHRRASLAARIRLRGEMDEAAEDLLSIEQRQPDVLLYPHQAVGWLCHACPDIIDIDASSRFAWMNLFEMESIYDNVELEALER